MRRVLLSLFLAPATIKSFERCEKKDEKSTPKFVPSSSYHKEE
jgi:hypothetical protein